MKRYVVVFCLFCAFWAVSKDANPLVLFGQFFQIKQLERQLAIYKKQTEEMRRELEILQTDKGLEKYAREHFYMHSDDEEIIVLQ